ncbi:MAG: MFS transporter [Candidatus Moranbacteria bacterium]|nr:MFS transporter [Candidatus Moranbacteria bacterium]
MPKKHKEKINRSGIKIINLSAFIQGISAASIIYLESDYFKISAGSDNISLFFIVAYAVSLFLIFNWHYLIHKWGKKKVFLGNLFAKGLALFALSFLPVGKVGILFLMMYIILIIMSWIDLDILLETYSRDSQTGRIRGKYLTIMNLGYLVSPFFAGLIVDHWGFGPIFFLATLLTFSLFFLNYFFIRRAETDGVRSINFRNLLKQLLSRPNISRIFYISFLLEFFYALMVIYVPLYLLELGFSWADLGEIFTFMLVPFVILQYPAGFLADKKYEEKHMLIVALAVMAASTFSIFFLETTNLFLWGAVLFFTRVGASLIEILRDSYFYKRIDSRDIDIINFFRSLRPLASITGLLIAAPIVYFLHIRFVFPLVAIASLSGIFTAANLAHNHILPKKKARKA